MRGAFVHEWIIYDYLAECSDKHVLRLKAIRKRGSYVHKEKWTKAILLESGIADTSFPDIEEIRLEGDSNSRSAEVKFKTSEFNYHKSDPEAFREFATRNGFILVVSHDQTPEGLDEQRVAWPSW